MAHLEYHDLGDGELIVNVTNELEISRVTDELAKTFSWEGFELGTLEEEGTVTEWLTLTGVRRLTAAQPVERAA